MILPDLHIKLAFYGGQNSTAGKGGGMGCNNRFILDYCISIIVGGRNRNWISIIAQALPVSIFFGLTELSLQWTTVCNCCKLDESWWGCTDLHRNRYMMINSLSSSRPVAAASETLHSVRSKQAFKSCSVSLVHLFTVLNTGLADLSFCL